MDLSYRDSPVLPPGLDLIERYRQLLARWNQNYNLVSRHLSALELQALFQRSLTLIECLPILDSAQVLDLGSGAGLPGILIAILHPGWQVTLLEPRQHRVRFLEYVKRELKLSTTVVTKDRFPTQALATKSFTYITCQGVGALDAMLPQALERLAPRGRLVATRPQPVIADKVKAWLTIDPAYRAATGPNEYLIIVKQGIALGE